MQHRRTEAPGEAEAREAIPDPKKPTRKWLYIFLAAHVVSQFSMLGFKMADMQFNSFIALFVMCITFILLGLELFYFRHKRMRKYRDELRERQNLRDTVRGRPRFRGRPWPSPQRVSRGDWDTGQQPSWRTQRREEEIN